MKQRLRLAAPLLAALLLGACATAPDRPVEPPPAPAVVAPPAPPASAPEVPAEPPRAEAPVDAPAGPPAVVTAIDPVRPDVAVDLDAQGAHTDLWQRLRDGFAIVDLDTDLVRERERWYADRPDYVQRMTDRGSRYLFHIVEELDKRGMPMELALLPFIESAFNPTAMSHAKAAGMWQFMPATGRHFDLQQNLFRDDRRDVLASTRAALDYLGRLFNMFGDWHLALAAYNWGEGNVQRAIRRNRDAGLPTDYLSLRMPLETRHYVPKLQAVKNIVLDPQAFGLALPPLENHPYFLAVPIERDIDVDLVVQLAGVSAEQFHQLNPQLNKPVILAAGTPQVLLPYDNADAFVRNLAYHKGALASWTAWRAPRTLKPAEAAKLVGMTEARLREVNKIPPRMLVRAGSVLLVPRSGNRDADVPPQVADHATIALAPERVPLQRVVFRAGKKGDSVVAVARRYGTSAANVARWNKVSTRARFAPGAQVVVYVRPSGGGARSAAATKPGPKSTAKAPAKRAGRR